MIILVLVSVNHLSYSQKSSFVPDDFEIPEMYDTDSLKFRVLTNKYLELDYDAVVTSVDHLQGVFGPYFNWPPKNLTIQEDSTDLLWHENEFMKRTSFTYTVLSPDEAIVIGCVYIYPCEKKDYDAMVILWVRSSVLRYGKDELLFETTKDWIGKEWPFNQAAYPGRDIKWSDWKNIK